MERWGEGAEHVRWVRAEAEMNLCERNQVQCADGRCGVQCSLAGTHPLLSRHVLNSLHSNSSVPGY